MSRLRRRIGGEAGYSLVEMLIVLSILGVVMASLTALFVSASNAEIDMNLKWQAQQNARLGLDRLRREIHCASTVTKNPSGAGLVSGITIALPSGCTGGGVNVTWCTQAIGTSGARWGLYRVNNSATCSGGLLIADYLTAANVFDYTVTTGSLAKVNIDLPVNIKPSKALYTYELKDDIVLRNSARG